jgi:hypothetical protein
VDNLNFGEPVRISEIIWALMNEDGVKDARNVRLMRYPSDFDNVDFTTASIDSDITIKDVGQNIDLQVNQIPVLVDDASNLNIV